MILCVISMFIYVCDCIGLRNIVIMKYMYLAMLYPINDLIWFNLINFLYMWVSHLRPVSRVSCVFDSYSTTKVTSLLRGIIPSSGEFILNYMFKPLVFLGVGVGRGRVLNWNHKTKFIGKLTIWWNVFLILTLTCNGWNTNYLNEDNRKYKVYRHDVSCSDEDR